MANFFVPGHHFHARPSKRKQERKLKAHMQHRAREEAQFEALEVAKYETWEYLDEFLSNSWGSQKDQISIRWENLPSRDALFAYGELDKTQGTLACRRLFKAVVIWEEVGCSLWEELNRAMQPRSNESSVSSLETLYEQDSVDPVCPWESPATTPNMSRSPSKSSKNSRSPSRHRKGSADSSSDAHASNYTFRNTGRKCPSRSNTMPEPQSEPVPGFAHAWISSSMRS